MKDARGDLIHFSRMALTAASDRLPGTPRAGPTLLHHDEPSSGGGNGFDAPIRMAIQTYAGIVNCSPRRSTAQAMRAFLAAMATIARQ